MVALTVELKCLGSFGSFLNWVFRMAHKPAVPQRDGPTTPVDPVGSSSAPFKHNETGEPKMTSM